MDPSDPLCYSNNVMKQFYAACLLVSLALAPAGATDVDSLSTAPAGSEALYIVRVDGMIDNALARYIDRAVDEAEAANATVFLHMDTFGGLVDAADVIRKRLLDAQVPIVTLIDKNAASAGALISIASNTIHMVPGSSIGAATVVQGGSGEAAPDKYQSYMRGLMRATAEARGRNPQIAEAMVDESIFVAGISDSGKVLTLSAEEALRVGIADEIVDDLSASIATMNLENVSRIDHQTSGVERFLRFFGSPVVQSILMMMMLGGLYFELQTPGVGFPGLMSAIGASLFFAPNYLYGLVEVWEVALFVLGVILIILELLVFPGFGISGILGGTLVLGSLVISMVGNVGFSFPDSTAVYRAINTLVISFFLTVGVSLYVGKRIVRQGSALSKLVLQPELDRSSGYVSAVSHVELVGAVGETLTPLRPSGVADIGGVRVDVVSQGDFIASGERIEVIRVQGSRVLVKRAAAGGQQA